MQRILLTFFLVGFLHPAKPLAYGNSPSDQVVNGVSGVKAQRSSSGSLMRVIEREEIEAMNMQNLNDLLRYLVLFDALNLGAEGQSVDFSATGRKTVLVVKDGMPIWNSAQDRVDFTFQTLQDIHKVYVHYGPASVKYGSNAVQVLLYLESMVQEKVFSASASLNSEALFHQNILAAVGGRIGRHRLRLNYGRYFFSGHQGKETGRQMEWVPRVNHQANLRYQYRIARGVTYYLQADYSGQLKEEKGLVIPNTVRAEDDRQSAELYHVQSGIIGQLSQRHFLHLNGTFSKYNFLNSRYMVDLHTLEQRELPEELPSDKLMYEQYLLTAHFEKKDTSFWNYQFGLDFNHQRDREFRGLDNSRFNITQFGVFGTGQLNWKTSHALIGTRYNAANGFGTPLAYLIRIGTDVTKNWSANMSLNSSYRIPAYNELFYTFTDPSINLEGNLNLQAETYQRIQFGTHFSKDNWYVGMQIYRENSADIIRLQQVDSLTNSYSFLNIGEQEVLGQQIRMEHQSKYLDVGLDLANVGINQFPDSASTFSFFQQTALQLRGKWPEKGWYIHMFLRGNSDKFVVREGLTGELEDFKQEGSVFLDASIQKRLKSDALKATVGVKNVFNVVQLEGTYLPLERLDDTEIINTTRLSIDLPRRIWFSLSYTW
jgi:outer membrane cobalamin receptor